jgi:hypothetical protein
MSDESSQAPLSLSLMERLRDLFTDNIADSEELVRVLRKDVMLLWRCLLLRRRCVCVYIYIHIYLSIYLSIYMYIYI